MQRGSPRADENIRNIKMDLTDAVDTCLDAAGHELDQSRQKDLLKAASFGKAFLDAYPADKFSDMCRAIRVLNAVRHYDIGMPLTYDQYTRLTADVLVNRLIQRHHHLVALRICDYLKINRNRVLIHWGCAKIKRSLHDEETLCRMIVEKLGEDSPGMSYIEVAKAAYEAGQTKLATRLLDYEPQAANQVPLLMSMKEDEIALVKAIESGDTDLVYLVILHMKRQLSPAEFYKIISGKPLACSLFEAYCREQDVKLLRDFYYQDDRRVDNANATVMEAYGEAELADRTNHLKVAAKLYAEDKEHAFESKSTEDQLRLLQQQTVLERETAHEFLNLSLSETIFKLILLGHANRAAKLKSDFKMGDKRFWWLKIRGLIQSHNWEALEKFAKTNQKFGYVGIVDTLISAGALSQAQKYVEMMVRAGGQQERDAQQYLELLTKAGSGAASLGGGRLSTPVPP
ncbi:hypothetical protein HDV00_011482 [Rhizophlyctis rosea]|nr:hypothetical protein HDV00_011482 [Rhizophlyctis rosea]